MARINKLWRAVGGPGVPPAVSKRRVKARVNAALNAGQQERTIYMKRKLCTAMAAVAILIAITGTAFAAFSNWSALSAWFTGDTSPGRQYLDSEVRSVSDGNYTLTVESAAADESSAYMVVSITALSGEAKAFLNSEDFISMDTFGVGLVKGSKVASGGGSEMVRSFSTYELEAPEENQRRFALSADMTSASAGALRVRCGYMDADASVEVPLAPAPSITVRIGASGTGVLEMYPVSTLDSETLTIKEITLSPFTCRVEAACSNSDIHPRLLLRMADGSIRTQSQLMDYISGHFDGYIYKKAEYRYRFNEVQDLDNIVSVIVFDKEYPLDGSTPAPVEHDPALDPFLVKRMDRLAEGAGFSLPVRDLTEKLGGTCKWDAAREEMTCVYRDVAIVLRPGSLTALVDGEIVELSEAPAMQDGVLAAPYQIFEENWGIKCCVLREEIRKGDRVENVWGDWYILP